MNKRSTRFYRRNEENIALLRIWRGGVSVSRSTKFYRKNEKEIMNRLGFKPTINSGSGWI